MSKDDRLFDAIGGKKAQARLQAVYGPEGAEGQLERYAALAAELAADRPEAAREGRFYSAPGRTELGGNHTDHNRGRVLCAAVDMDALACVVPNADLRCRIASEGYEPFEIDLSELDPRPEERGTTAALLRGTARALRDRGVAIRGFEARISSTVLPGSGLSSSAAVEVLFAAVLSGLAGAELPPRELAIAGRYAENEFFGKPCGLMDQMASALGGIVTIDFADPARPRASKVDFDLEAAGYALFVVDTGGSHADLTEDYAAIPAEMRAVAAFLGGRELRDIEPERLVERGPEIRAALGDRALLRAFHYYDENARVLDMVEALEEGEVKAYLKLVRRSGISSWRLLQNLHPPKAPTEQGLCLALALSEDFLGKKGASRVHGGGFAGTIQAYVPLGLAEGYAALMDRYFGAGSARRLAIRPTGATRVF